jgi:hypothetical protein
LELLAEAVAGLAVLPMGALFFGAFSGAERLTLNVSLCCANPLTLIPKSTTAIANENLIFFNPLPGIPCFGTSGHLSLDARTLPHSAHISLW